MAGDDKTERATPKRREEARKEGSVARSMEINSAFAMLAGFGVLVLWGPRLWNELQRDTVRRLEGLSNVDPTTMDIADTMAIFFDVTKVLLALTAPILLTLVIVGVLASVVQVRPKFEVSAIKPRFSKINPIQGAKQKFGPPALFEFAKNVVKLIIVGVPAAWLVWDRRYELLNLGDADPLVAGALAVDLTMSIGLRIAGVYVALALIDYIYQKHRFEKNIRMTKQEVKQEMRQQDVSPEMKAQQRRRQREAARRRMLSDVPDADVIITNPTHYAIALKYDTELGAPQVVAKGVDLLALRIREIGEEAGVMRVENRVLARELYAQVEVGNFIPGELFAAVAEVLAYVYRAEGRARASGEASRAGEARRSALAS